MDSCGIRVAPFLVPSSNHCMRFVMFVDVVGVPVRPATDCEAHLVLAKAKEEGVQIVAVPRRGSAPFWLYPSASVKLSRGSNHTSSL